MTAPEPTAPTVTAWLDQLTALRAKATPGPWLAGAKDGAVAVRRSDVEYESRDGATFSLLLPGPEMWNPTEAWANAALIVAAVNSLPQLIDAVRAVKALADERDRHHAPYCCTVDCPDGGEHTDPTDPIRIEELVGIWGESPPPLRDHRTIPCPKTCTCPTGPNVAEIRTALAGLPR